MTRRLGKLPPRHDPRTLLFSAYLDPHQLPAPPPARDWTHAAAPVWGMMANDRLGDCTCAAAGHLMQAWTANHGAEFTPTDEQIVAAYSEITGYNANYPDTDQGAVELDVLKHWRTTGIAGRKIGAFVKVEPASRTHVEAAINLLGGVYLGAALPQRAQSQTIWDVPDQRTAEDAPGSWGGHAMAALAYSRAGVVFVTWGGLKVATWNWWLTYVDECYGLLDDEWVSGAMPAPNGFNLDALKVDLGLIGTAKP